MPPIINSFIIYRRLFKILAPAAQCHALTESTFFFFYFHPYFPSSIFSIVIALSHFCILNACACCCRPDDSVERNIKNNWILFRRTASQRFPPFPLSEIECAHVEILVNMFLCRFICFVAVKIVAQKKSQLPT